MSVIVQSLSKQYGVQRAVDGLSFEARKGEILGFLGPNGAGKTTTMKMICCYTSPTEGTAIVNGYDIHNAPLKVKNSIGYLPEHNPLYEDMYVREYLQFVASIHRLHRRKDRIQEVIELTGLAKEQHKIIGTLSKGYRQRIGLAQAIIHDPDVLILDEPTSGLDMNQLVDIRSLIKSLGHEKTVIFSSHIMQEVQAICDRVVIINNGVKVADATMEELSRIMDENDAVLVQFTEKRPELNIFKDIHGLTEITTEGHYFVFHHRKGNDIRPDIFRKAAAHHYIIIEMRERKASMEDIFRQVTQKKHYV